jgi:hypothetical protein
MCYERQQRYFRFEAPKTASKPIGVVQYKLSKKLLEELRGKLPSVEDFKQLDLPK